jgi:hypothetical protein
MDKSVPQTLLTSSAPNPASSPRNILRPSSALSFCVLPKSALPRSAPIWKKPTPLPAVAVVWTNQQPITPTAYYIWCRMPDSTTCLVCPRLTTSARRSTKPCATLKNTTRSSPASCPKPTIYSPARRSRNCSKNLRDFRARIYSVNVSASLGTAASERPYFIISMEHLNIKKPACEKTRKHRLA